MSTWSAVTTRRRSGACKLGQSTPGVVAVTSGLNDGDRVVVDGIQRVRPGQAVSPQTAGSAERVPGRCTGLRAASVISAAFIRRPRLAAVIAIVITLAGAIAMLRIPVAQFPDIVPPRVQVTAIYPGASAAVVEAAIAQPLEAQIVGVDKMIYMKSTSGNDGSYNLTVWFAVGTNPDTATVNVNNRVQTALPQLPQAVQLQGLTVIKRSAAILQFMNLYSETGKLSPVYITSYATINVLDELSRVPGVGQALLFGKLNYSMRIWFDTQRLTSLNLAPSDVVQAIQAQNVQAPVGRIGARPVADDQQFQLNVQTQGTLTTPEQFRKIVLRANPDGSVLRIGDVARVEMGAQNEDNETRINGRPAVGVALYLAPDANAVATAAAVARTLARLSARFPPGPQGARRLRFDGVRERHHPRGAVDGGRGLHPGGDRRLPVPGQPARHRSSRRSRCRSA